MSTSSIDEIQGKILFDIETNIDNISYFKLMSYDIHTNVTK